ncbi:MAG TPA: AsmA family protein, partial [Candidatus Angelobacter sp.]|nr:AsmA family protein [Candidatus Angelobacter sp.]
MKRLKKWQKIVLWSLAGVVALLLVAAVTLMLLLEHSEGFRRDILGKVESSIEESTGARLEVGDFKFRLSNLTLDIYNIVLHGREADPSKPLLTADHLQVGLTIDSLLRRTWHVRDIVLDHPVVRMQVNKAGENNLPQPQKKSTSSDNTNIFDLAIRELKLDRGEIYYNDQKTPLDAELRNFALNANYDPAQNKYAGQLGYNNGRIVYGKYAPMEHNFQAHFGITPQTFTLDKLELAAGKSHVVLSATVNDYSSPNRKADARYEAELVTGEFQRILRDPSIPAGTVKLEGQVKYQGDPNRAMLETVAVNGNVSSGGLAVKTPGLQTQVRDVYARYTLAHGNAEVSDIRARILGGVLNAKLTIRDVSGAGVARLQATLNDLSLDQAQAAMHRNPAQQAHLTGKLNAEADARWARTLDNLNAHSDLTMQGSVGQGQAMPLDGVVHADYAAARKQVALTNSYIRTPKTTLTMNGEVSNHCQLQVALRSNDLHEVEQLMAALSPQDAQNRRASGAPAQGQQAQQLGLYGTAVASASVSGPLSAPQVNGQLEARNLRVKGSSWKLLRTGFSANPSLASVTNGDLEALPAPQNAQPRRASGTPGSRGQIKFSAQARLKNWAYMPSNPITANVSASQISLTDLERLLDKTYPVSGTLALNVSLRGSQLNPVGQGTLTVTNAKVSSENVQSVNLKFQGNGNAINGDLTVKMPAG